MTSRDPLDQLYAAPLAEFVATRDRLAADLAREGRKDEGQALKKLRRPSPSAWATNQVAREARAAVDDMLAASDRLRRSQDALLAGRSDQIAYQTGVDELRRATAALSAAAREVLERAGRGGRELVDGVVANVRVAALDGERRRELLEARLTADLEAGEHALAGFLGTGAAPTGARARADAAWSRPAAPKEPAGPSSEALRREKEKREEHARRVTVARSEAAAARDVAARAETTARTARATREQVEARVAEAERALAAERDALRAAQKAADAADKHLASVTAEAKAAARRLDALEDSR